MVSPIGRLLRMILRNKQRRIGRAEPGAVRQIVKIYKSELKADRKNVILFTTFITIGHLFRFVITPLILSFLIQSLVTNPDDLTTAYTLVGLIAISAIFNTVLNDKGY